MASFVWYLEAGLIWPGKVRGKGFPDLSEKGLFHLGPGKSGKLAMVTGKIAFSCYRAGK